MTLFVAFVLALFVQQPTPARPSQPPPCATAEDPTYGLTPANPVQVGRGAMYVGARERRYMDALRGPEGQAIRYKRVGSLPQTTNSSTILDQYEVTYDGLEKPLMLYLDAYHYWEQRAPVGLTCGQAIQLQPMLDGFAAFDSVMAVALEQGAAQDFAPIPLGADGSTRNGVMWDGFRMMAAAARTAALAGATLAPAAARELGRTVVLAHSLDCDGRTIAPVGIDILPPQGRPVARSGELLKDEAIATLLPGVKPPASSVAARFQLQQIRPNDRVRITYAEAACPQGTTEVLLPVRFSPARAVELPPPALPEAANPAERRLLLQVLIDHEGVMRRGTYAGGPSHLQQAAIEGIKTWRAEPARINGAPIVTSTLLEVRFK